MHECIKSSNIFPDSHDGSNLNNLKWFLVGGGGGKGATNPDYSKWSGPKLVRITEKFGYSNIFDYKTTVKCDIMPSK